MTDTTQPSFEQVRDVPASCICWWEFRFSGRHWHRIKAIPGCPWHLNAGVPWSAEVQP